MCVCERGGGEGAGRGARVGSGGGGVVEYLAFSFSTLCLGKTKPFLSMYCNVVA